MKDLQLTNIIKQAVGKRFTYLTFENKNGLKMSTFLTNLEIDSISEQLVYVHGKKVEWNEIVTIPLSEIDYIEEIEEGKIKLENAEAEYIVHYYDQSELFIQIYNRFD